MRLWAVIANLKPSLPPMSKTRQPQNTRHPDGNVPARWRLLIITGLFGLVLYCPEVLASSYPGASSIPQPPTSQSSFESWLSATGRPVYSRYNGYAANYSTYKTYKMLVYGKPTQVPDNEYDSLARQYAYLGFSYDELTVTNSLYRDDGSGVTTTSPWDWEELELGAPATLSWSRLSARQKTFIKLSLLTYRGNYYGGMTYKLLQFSELKTLVLTVPAWHLNFALYTRHYHPIYGTLRYATFNGFGGGGLSLACNLSVQTPPSSAGANIYDIPPGQDYLDLTYAVSGSIKDWYGLALDSDIAYRGAGNDLGWVQGSGNGPWTSIITQRVLLSDLAGAAEMPFTLSGSAWSVSQMGDIEKVGASKTITIRSPPESPPFLVDFSVVGNLAYFASRVSLVGRSMPRDQHRFLGLEKITFRMRFNQVPENMTIDFLGQTYNLNGQDDNTDYRLDVRLPVMPSTLSWTHERLQTPYEAVLHAKARDFPELTLESRIQDIEITGDIHDLYHVQAG